MRGPETVETAGENVPHSRRIKVNAKGERYLPARSQGRNGALTYTMVRKKERGARREL